MGAEAEYTGLGNPGNLLVLGVKSLPPIHLAFPEEVRAAGRRSAHSTVIKQHNKHFEKKRICHANMYTALELFQIILATVKSFRETMTWL